MFRTLRFYLKHAIVFSMVLFLGYWAWLDKTVVSRFEQQRWDIPARVYAAPLELYADAPVSREQLVANLELLGYQRTSEATRSGQYSVSEWRVNVVTRGFDYPDATEPARVLDVEFDAQSIIRLSAKRQSASNSIARLEPLEIGVIHPGVFEDRALLKLSEVRRVFLERLIAVEDKRFYDHPGVDIRGIARAMFANIVAGRMRQGGSTITQQLIKNLYLSRERSLSRKFREALMALSLERNFSKNDILQTYLNHIYLGQDGNRAVHGFGLGAEFYFGKPLLELNLSEQALLIGLIKGPSAYNPRRRPEEARARRDTVLGVLYQSDLISESEYEAAKAQPLGVVDLARRRASTFAAFKELVHQRLLANYDRQELQTKGLRIFTTLDPLLQQQISEARAKFLAELSERKGYKTNQIQIAAVWAEPLNAEVKGLIGGRGRGTNYNRALYAKRQIGSLIKPIIVAEALSRPADIRLGSILKDQDISLTDERGEIWEPKNYDRTTHGDVTVLDALVNSYNLAMIDLGLKIGLPSLEKRLRSMGLERENIPLYPSMLLGALEMTPFEVAQLYHTIANQGFYAPLRAIRSVVDAKGRPLSEAHTSVKQALSPGVAYLTTYALQQVINQGTGRGLRRFVPDNMSLAGKTGTTDDTRDSWFAGFGGNLLGVVWLGNDDATSTGLTGASGALRAWGRMASMAKVKPLKLSKPTNVEDFWFDPENGLAYSRACDNNMRRLPAIKTAILFESMCEQTESGKATNSGSLWDGIRSWLNNN